MSSHRATYLESIERLKSELANQVAELKSTTEWANFEKIYRAICAIEDVAGVPRQTVDEIFGLASQQAQSQPPEPKATTLPIDGQIEPEAATELEKGA